MMRRIFWAGDSTVQYNDITTYPQTGIGQAFCLYVKQDVKVINLAKNGRSTKSFIDEERHLPIEKNIGKGDFLFIQFGHNDEKIADPSRYTDPNGSFRDNLRFFIRMARDHAAYPVLITPLERKLFDNGVLRESAHTAYVEAMKEVGREEQVPVIDLCTMSRNKLLEVGEQKSFEWYMELPEGVYPVHMEGLHDSTHLKYSGAVVFGGMIAQELKKLGGVYEDLLVDWSESEKKYTAGLTKQDENFVYEP